MKTIDRPDLTLTPGFEGDGPGCPCCGGEGGRIFGFVYRDGAPLGVYQAGEAGLPGSGEVVIATTIGPFDRGSTPADRLVVAFVAEAGEGPPKPSDRAVPGWPEVEDLGVRLSAREAEMHPRAAEFRAMAELAIAQDGRLRDALAPRGTLVFGFSADAPVGNGRL